MFENKPLIIFKLFCFGLVFLTKLVFAQPSINYLLTYDQKNSQCLNVKAEIDAQDLKLVKLQLPLFGLQKLQYSKYGAIEFRETDDEYIKEIHQTDQGKILLEYVLCLQNPNKNIIFPIIEPEFIHLVAQNFLIRPIDSPDIQWDISLHLAGFEPSMHFYSSISDDKQSFQFQMTPRDFEFFALVGSKEIPREIKVGKKSIHVIKQGQFEVSEQKILADLKKIMSMQTDFWNDQAPLIKTITLIGNGGEDVLIGRHYENALSMYLPAGKDYKFFAWSVSHELTHGWNGYKIKISPYDHDIKWFLEGFTDYIGLKIAHDSHVISDEEYVEFINEILVRYYNNPLNHLGHSEVKKGLTFDFLYQQLEQLRGHLALYQLFFNEEKNDEYKLSLAMQGVLSHFEQNPDKIYDSKSIEKLLLKYFGDEWELIKNQMDGLSKIKLPARLLSDKVELKHIEVQCPDYGFDHFNFVSQHIIKNLKKESSAYLAGLREGDVVVSNMLGFYAVDKAVTIHVKREGIVHKYTFLPETKTIVVPQYQKI